MTGTFPDHFKTAVVTSVYKGKSLDAQILSSYRPVSNLNYISKLFEKLVHVQLCEYLDTNGILDKYQSGFRTNHGVESALMKVT